LSVFPKEQVVLLASKFNDKLDLLADETDFSEGSSVYESFKKHQKKRNPENDSRIAFLIKKELVLRTVPGKKLLKELLKDFEQSLSDITPYQCFTHNDPHCENFVIVKYLFQVVKNNHQYIDREFINEILSKREVSDSATHYSIEYISNSNTLLYREYREGDEQDNNVNIFNRDLQYDIHMIDIDDATGITSESKRSYLSDLLVYALSVQNLSAIKGGTLHRDDVISAYYNYL